MRKAGPEGMVTETLEIGSGGPGLRALVTRAVGLDAGASVRLRQLTDDVVDVFVTTPFEVVASLSLIHISEPTRRHHVSRMPSSA